MDNLEILDFVAKEENLQIAMDVYDHIQELKDRTHREFWVAMNHELARLVDQDCYGKWIFHNFNLKALKKPWGFANITMVVPPKDNIPPLLDFGIGQDSKEKNFHIMCGVRSKYGTIPELTVLRGLLISVDLDRSDGSWWAGLGNLSITPYTTKFIFEMYHNKEEFIKKSAQLFWNKFLILRPEVEKFNQQLLEAHE